MNTNASTIGSSTSHALREAAMQQQDSGTIPRIVVVVGSGDADSVLVMSDIDVQFVIVSEQQGEVEQCLDLDAAGDLDSVYKLGKDIYDNNVVLVGPYGPLALGEREDIDHFWRQAPMFADRAPEPTPGIPSEAFSEASSEAISEAISGQDSGLKSDPGIWADKWCWRCGKEAERLYDIKAISEMHICPDCVLDLLHTDPSAESVMKYVQMQGGWPARYPFNEVQA